MDASLFDALESRLAMRPPQSFDLPGRVWREASVLVPLLMREGAPHVLFTKRPTTLRRHAGQYSFPGGMRDAEDPTDLQTALRETREELGIDVSGVRVLGALDEVPTTSDVRIRPFVGVLPQGLEYRPNPAEVEFILEVPLSHLLDPAIHRTERHVSQGMEYEVSYYTYGAHVVWGATGHILRGLLRLITPLSGG